MTTETLVAGRELDSIIAERVMGLVQCQGRFHDEQSPNTYCYAHPDSPTQGAEVKQYSTDIAAAWEVIGQFDTYYVLYGADALFACSISDTDMTWIRRGIADTAPLAICLAALQAVEK